MKSLGILALSFLLFLLSCRKDSFISSPDARVTISSDTLKFDTVFVTAGSTYQTFTIKNDNSQKLRLSSIRLMGGSGSVYKINVDGTPGVQFNNLEIEANDSLYVFAQVNVNPGAANLPFILRDSIEITYNGKKRLVQLEAWGQNAHFFRDKVINVNETWNNDLPYVILGSLFVNTNQILTINKGCRIYVHADAPIVVNGTLFVNGLKDTADRVYFRGDRLDEPYKDFPASWPGIFFQASSINNVLNYAVLKNAYQAIAVVDPPPVGVTKLTLNECIIDNAYDFGIVAINSSIKARNCLVSNCGKNVYLIKGGNYEFTHCTVVTYANRYIDHRDPVLLVTNKVQDPRALTALFRNCIFWGENGLVDNEVDVSTAPGSSFSIDFNYNLWKVQTNPLNTPGVTGTNLINGQPPLFDSINTFKNYFNFHLKTIPRSPAIDAGNNITRGIPDLDFKQRTNVPDLGCYEAN